MLLLDMYCFSKTFLFLRVVVEDICRHIVEVVQDYNQVKRYSYSNVMINQVVIDDRPMIKMNRMNSLLDWDISV